MFVVQIKSFRFLFINLLALKILYHALLWHMNLNLHFLLQRCHFSIFQNKIKKLKILVSRILKVGPTVLQKIPPILYRGDYNIIIYIINFICSTVFGWIYILYLISYSLLRNDQSICKYKMPSFSSQSKVTSKYSFLLGLVL